jgi:hypothetical protein
MVSPLQQPLLSIWRSFCQNNTLGNAKTIVINPLNMEFTRHCPTFAARKRWLANASVSEELCIKGAFEKGLPNPKL